MSGECQCLTSFHLDNQHNLEKTKFHLEAAAIAGNEVLETNWENLNLIILVIMSELLRIGSLLHLLGSTCHV